MKQALVLTAIIGVVFIAGILVGGALGGGDADPTSVASTRPAPQPEAPRGPMPTPPVAGTPAAGGPAASPGAARGSEEPAAPGGRDDEPPPPSDPMAIGEPPSEPPPPISPAALAEGDRIKAELAAEEGPGNGRVTTLVPGDFESPEERAAWEEARKKRWEKRLARENDIKIEEMRDKVGLKPGQEEELRRILADELKERTRLVDALTAKEISRTSFDEAVRENVTKARQRLQNLFTPEQYAAYQQLAPREQVLREDTK